ncbi:MULTISPECIES: hybrid sensor histidine kinase/response regulator [unclassified Burkholderia]|uniref:hybrid sensor histidine kinase/response regulator n=1 Tax=unclassified Burkholderia TaxID=2613784 RepID=UPI00158EC48B|nr:MULTISPECIES: hybrid sensor histidine kinase/response regulator [unclassified Burkholderia]
MPLLRQTLGELRRYHRLLMTGGRCAAVLVMIVALLADVTLLVRTYIDDEREMFTIAHRLVRGRVAANEHSFLNGLVRAELSWSDEHEVPASLIARFRARGNLLSWKPFPAERLELLIAAAPGAQPTDDEIAHYIQFATQIGRANIAMSKVLERQSTQIFFSPGRQIVGILPTSSIDSPARLTSVAGRTAFVQELTDGAEALLDAVPPGVHNVRPVVNWSPHRYRLPNGQEMLRLAAPVVHHGRIEAVLVDEVDPADLVWPILDGAYKGVYAIVNDNGDVIATAAKEKPNLKLLDYVSQWQRAHGPVAGRVVEHRDGGRYLLARRIGTTGYSLVYSYSWLDIADAIWSKALAAAAISLAVLVAIWFMLYQLNRRVFRPMYARSEQVFDSERLSRTVIETVPVGIGLVSAGNGALLYGGSSLHALSHLIEGGMDRLLGELAKRYVRLKAARVGESDEVFQEDVMLPTIDRGEIALQARFALGRYLGEDVIVAAFVDMTANRELQQQLRDAKVAADQASAAKSAFLATMSHEIRTPLNAIMGNLELLAHSSLNPLQRDRLRTIRTSSNGLLAIIQDVLDFSKIEAGEMQFERIQFKVADVIERALTMFAPVAHAKGIELYGMFGASIDQPMHGDPVRLAQVVHNLLSNAIKFTDEGKVTLGIAYEPTVGDIASSGTLVVTVTDTGIGIDAEQRAQLFKAFAQADSSISRRFGGTGLGLALCQRLTVGMGGTIEFDGDVGRGSRFTVRVPLDQIKSSDTSIMADARILAGKRVMLLAEANEWHTYAATLIEAWGAEIDAFRHPDDLPEVSGRVLVICGDRNGWSADSENRIVEDCQAVINCGVSCPLQPVRVGRVVTVSCYAPAGLRAALDHLLNNKPLVPLDEACTAGASADSHVQAPQLGLHVLVAEDNEVNQRLFDEQLTLLGCTAQIVADGVDALRVLSDETFDVVLTDLNMPRMDGYVLAQIMRARWPQTPIVAVTADATVDERRRCAELGVRTVISKPLSLDGLARVLTQATGGAAHGVGDGTSGALLGEHAMPASLFAVFHKSCTKSLEVLKAAHARGDVAAMLSELHSLKGALGIVQQHELAQQCSVLERQLRMAEPGQAHESWQLLSRSLEAVISDRSFG